ncbi:MAG TPA: alpha/beta fold hydrolase [archaeon]|nr:alpha/beta fold hydrolase [archaeon]
MKITILLVLVALLFCGCSSKNVDVNGSDDMQEIEKVEFKTSDGFKIKGNLHAKGKTAIILLHQFQLDRTSYGGFAKKLSDANYTVLAIDLRGHGNSNEQNGKFRTFKDFSEKDFRDMEEDVNAAKRFLQLSGYDLKYIVGSSIGANTALNYASHNPSIEKVVLLSPGINYKGIDTQKNAANVNAKVLIVASSEDEYSFASSKELTKLIQNSNFEQLHNAGHGTYMFAGTNIENEILKWLKAEE